MYISDVNRYYLKQNGLYKRKNRTLVDTARCLVIEANRTVRFRAEHHAVVVLLQVSTGEYRLSRGSR